MRWVYNFWAGGADGGRDDRATLGGKGADLAEMARMGLAVPPGFTLSTDACRAVLAHGGMTDTIWAEVERAIGTLEARTGRRFGDPTEPLLVSVRSGGPVSMPGMMDTILDLGGSADRTHTRATVLGAPGFAWDCHRRFVQMYGEVVEGVPAQAFESELAHARRAAGVVRDSDLPAPALEAVARRFDALVSARGRGVPDDPRAQLRYAIEAVFRSWNNPRARDYRRVHQISEDLGTAVNVQAMVYGNLGEDSGSGVAFTRNPATGEARLFGEFLVNAQGEDVVAGVRDPEEIDSMIGAFAQARRDLDRLAATLEDHYRDMQDVEFVVEQRRLFVLQTRTGKRTGQAAVRIAVDMVDEGRIDRDTALLRVDPAALAHTLHPTLDPATVPPALGRGLPASPGAASGQLVFSAEAAQARAHSGAPVLLVRTETSPDDFGGMVASRGILTSRGGMTSHAAVVARGMGIPCVAGLREARVDEEAGSLELGGCRFGEGDWLTLDGTSGAVYSGRLETREAEPDEACTRLLAWADERRVLRVRANADTPHDARRARDLGAEGIGLCRIEHMVLTADRLQCLRRLILAGDEAERRRSLDDLLPLLRHDVEEILRVMDGLPVTVRLIDPPLHEFLPADDDDDLTDPIRARLEALREVNPMLGHRGVRLGVTMPELTALQIRAVLEAGLRAKATGVDVHLEIMLPLVLCGEEVVAQRAVIEAEAERVFAEAGRVLPYEVGTMIELPRAALTAEAIAPHTAFFSFGTNDLTQTTLGLSRDDSGSFLPRYLEEGLLSADPFQTLDVAGVGRLIRMAIEEGRRARVDLGLGVCGEHGGDPASVEFFHSVGLDYVSCSPYRLPGARLAAARAAIQAGGAESVGSKDPGSVGERVPVPA